jgi:hypothetical protein
MRADIRTPRQQGVVRGAFPGRRSNGTELGQEVGGLVRGITAWAQANVTAVQAALEEFDERTAQRPL